MIHATYEYINTIFSIAANTVYIAIVPTVFYPAQQHSQLLPETKPITQTVNLDARVHTEF